MEVKRELIPSSAGKSREGGERQRKGMEEYEREWDFLRELQLPALATHKKRSDVVCTYWLRRRCAQDKDCIQLHVWDEARLPICKFGAPCREANRYKDLPCVLRHRDDDDKEECVNFRLGFCRCVRVVTGPEGALGVRSYS